MSLGPSKNTAAPSANRIDAIHCGYFATNIPHTPQRSFGLAPEPDRPRGPRRPRVRRQRPPARPGSAVIGASPSIMVGGSNRCQARAAGDSSTRRRAASLRVTGVRERGGLAQGDPLPCCHAERGAPQARRVEASPQGTNAAPREPRQTLRLGRCPASLRVTRVRERGGLAVGPGLLRVTSSRRVSPSQMDETPPRRPRDPGWEL